MSTQPAHQGNSYPAEANIINVNVICFANTIIDKGLEENNPVTHLHLHKLMYFVYGYLLVRHNKKIGATEFQPWDAGPVVELIFQVMRGTGSEPITRYCEEFDHKKIKLTAYVIDKKEVSFHQILDEVWNKYRNLSANHIIRESHLPGGAWAKARSESLAHLSEEHIKEEFAITVQQP